MDISKILVIGIGQYGNLQADLMKRVENSLTTVYINSSLGDLKGLKYANLETNSYIYAGADGSGKDRDMAKDIFDMDKFRLSKFLSKFKQFDYGIVVSSLAGGTGSGTVIEVSKLIKKAIPGIEIGFLGASPSLKEDTRNLKNALECLGELIDDENKDLFVNKLIIDNDKDGDFSNINMMATTSIIDAYNLTGNSKQNRVDSRDLSRVFLESNGGYISILKINSEDGRLSNKERLLEAKMYSIFAQPDTLDCVYGAMILSDDFKIDEFKSEIKAEETIFACNGDSNTIVLGGCDFPVCIIEQIQDELNSRNDKIQTERKAKSKINIDTRLFNNKSKYEDKKTERSKRLEEDSIKHLCDVSKIDW